MFLSKINQRRWQNFKANRRAYWSLVLFLGIFLLSFGAEIIANDKPLVVKYKGEILFPFIQTYTDEYFDGDFATEADYKDPFIVQKIMQNGWMVMPVIPYSFNSVDYDLDKPTPTPPSAQHWLGTDDEGRDIVARILYGIRLSVVFSVVLTFFASVIGIVIGAVQGYFGGKIDLFVQRFLEIWDALPQLFILIIVASVFVPSFMTLLFIMLLFSWSALIPVVRAEFLRTRNFEFVKAAKALGVSNVKIIFKHILPNAVVATITYVPFLLSDAIVALSALDFLGLGLSADYPSLGDLVRQGKDNLQAPWIGITIFIVLSMLLTLLIFIGEGVRDAFNPRRRR